MPLRRNERLLAARLAAMRIRLGARVGQTREAEGLRLVEAEERSRIAGRAIPDPRPRLSSRIPLAPDGTYMFPGDELVPLVGERPQEYVRRVRGYRRRGAVVGGYVRGQGEYGRL